MATKMLVCPECESAVTPGRFACTSCGALLASVASAPRSLSQTESMTPPSVSPAAPAVDSTVVAATDRETGPEPIEPIEPIVGAATIGPAWAHGVLERAPSETDLDVEFDEDAPLAAATPELAPAAAVDPASGNEDEPPIPSGLNGPDPEPDMDVDAAQAPLPEAPAIEPEPEPGLEPEPELAIEPEPAPELLAEPFLGLAPGSGEPASVVGADELDVEVPAAAQAHEPQWPETRAWPPPGATQSPAWPEPAQRPRAGAYLPPSAMLTTVAEPAGTAADRPDAPAASTHASVAIADGPPTEAARTDARRMPGIDPAFPPQIVVVGAGIVALGFVLPWAPIVIGSGRIGGYLDQWGLAGPGHPLLLLVVIALGAFASQVDRLPRWARPGIPGLVLAGLLIGLLWPYFFGSIQASVGVYVTLAGALVLSVGGMLDLWLRRHAGSTRSV
jgi:hypothetical protein